MEPTYVKAAPAGPAHADATSTRSHTFTHCQELKFRGIVGCRLRGRRLRGRRLVGRFLGTEGNLEQGFQRFHVFETDLVPCAVHSPQLTRQASRRQEEEPRARQGDPTPHARRPTARASSLCIVRPRAAAGRGTAPHIPPPQPPRAQSRALLSPSVTSVVFFSSEVARALAPSSPMPLPAACTAPNPHGKGKRHADKRRSLAPGKGTRRRTRAAQPHARARSASCARARPPPVGPRHTSPFPSHGEHRAAHLRG